MNKPPKNATVELHKLEMKEATAPSTPSPPEVAAVPLLPELPDEPLLDEVALVAELALLAEVPEVSLLLVAPEEPELPDEPLEPEDPLEPEEPLEPEVSLLLVAPEEPELPEEPLEPELPDDPLEPEEPVAAPVDSPAARRTGFGGGIEGCRIAPALMSSPPAKRIALTVRRFATRGTRQNASVSTTTGGSSHSLLTDAPPKWHSATHERSRTPTRKEMRDSPTPAVGNTPCAAC